MNVLIEVMQRRFSKGFTIIELVVAIIILAILSATIIPRWFGTSGFEELGYKDEVVATLRAAQLKAMQQTFLDLCNTVIVENKQIGLLANGSWANNCDQNELADEDAYGQGVDGNSSVLIDSDHNISFASNTVTPWYIRFNQLGQPIASGCSAPCDVAIEIKNDLPTSEPTLIIKINAQGYIYVEQN